MNKYAKNDKLILKIFLNLDVDISLSCHEKEWHFILPSNLVDFLTDGNKKILH